MKMGALVYNNKVTNDFIILNLRKRGATNGVEKRNQYARKRDAFVTPGVPIKV